MKIKENIIEKNNDLYNNASICELGYYIGTKREIDDYIIKKFCNIDNLDIYVVFYLFCKYVIENFNKHEHSSIYELYKLIDYNYIKLVDMFEDNCVEKE